MRFVSTDTGKKKLLKQVVSSYIASVLNSVCCASIPLVLELGFDLR
jgi:hypothetical protein